MEGLELVPRTGPVGIAGDDVGERRGLDRTGAVRLREDRLDCGTMSLLVFNKLDDEVEGTGDDEGGGRVIVEDFSLCR